MRLKVIIIEKTKVQGFLLIEAVRNGKGEE